MMKKRYVISIMVLVVGMLSLAGCGEIKERVNEAIIAEKTVDKDKNSEGSLDESVFKSVAKDQGVSEKELEKIIDGLVEIGAEKFGITVDEYKEDIEADGGTLLGEFKEAADFMGISIKELYDYEKVAMENLTDEQKEVMAGMAEAADMAKDLLGDLEVGEKTEEEAIADVEALLGIESNTSGEIRLVTVEVEKAFDFMVKEVYQDYEDEYSYLFEYMSDGSFEELSEYYGALVKNTENYTKISAPGNAPSVMYSGRVNGMDLYIDIDGTAGNGNIVNNYLDYTSLEEEVTPDESNDDDNAMNSEESGTTEGLSLLAAEFPHSQVTDQFYMEIQGTTTMGGQSFDLYFDTYFKGIDVRIDTYWDGQQVAMNIYNSDEDITYTEYMRGTHFAEVISGNVMPVRLVDFDELELLTADEEVSEYTAEYRTVNGEETFYIETVMNDGTITAFWYSLEYHVPIQYYEEYVEEGETHIVEWEVVATNLAPLNDDLFALPEDMGEPMTDAEDYYGEEEELELPPELIREYLLYNVHEITNDEKALDGALTQILFYTESGYDEAVAYYVELLEGTDDYFVYEQEDRTSVDGSFGGNTIMVIVNDYAKTEGGMTGINVNWMVD